jgi:D-alanyl-D-alanine carboxypeptidase (penicillin-binding protein 5/6)
MKKGISVFFIFLSMILLLGTLTIKVKTKTIVANAITNSDLKSESAFLIEEKTGKILYSKNQNKKMQIASMTKIMTLLICYDNLNNDKISLDEDVIASKNASSMGGSQVFIEENGVYKVRELLKAITVASANDACVAMAEKIAGSEESFVDLMNKKARELELTNTNFINCTGLPKEGHYSSAKDVATMFKNLINNKNYFDFSTIWMDKIEHPNGRFTEISNTNKLIKFYKGCDGGKTGYTSEAGHCLCATATRDGTRLISVVIKSPDSKTRFNEVSTMFNYGFSNYKTKEIIKQGAELDVEFSIKNSKHIKPKITVDKSVYSCSKINEKNAYTYSFIKNDNTKAPLKAGDVIGKLKIYFNNEEIDTVNVILLEDLAEKNYFDIICDVVINWDLL